MSTELAEARKRFGVTQATMATHMGLPIRTYEDLEAGRSNVRPIHRIAFEMATIRLAIQAEDAALIPDYLQSMVMGAARLVEASERSKITPPA